MKRVLTDARIDYIVVTPGVRQAGIIKDTFQFCLPVMELSDEVLTLMRTSARRAAVFNGGSGVTQIMHDLPMAMYFNVDASKPPFAGYKQTYHQMSRAASRRVRVAIGEEDNDHHDCHEYIVSSEYLFTSATPIEWHVEFSQERYEPATTECSQVMDEVMARVARKLCRAQKIISALPDTPERAAYLEHILRMRYGAYRPDF